MSYDVFNSYTPSSGYEPQEGDILKCKLVIERILYPKRGQEHEPGDFAILSCRVESVESGTPYDTQIVIKGGVYSIHIGMTYNFKGSYSKDRYGQSYKIFSLGEEHDLTTDADKLNYLRSIFTPDKFVKLQTLDNPYDVLMNKDKKALMSIRGIKSYTADQLIEKFHANYSDAYLFSILNQYGLTMDNIQTLRRKYTSPDELIRDITENPYIMITKIKGVGWGRADALAMKRGIPYNDPKRVGAYVQYYIMALAEQYGHTWCYPGEIWQASSQQLGLKEADQSVLQDVLRSLIKDGTLAFDQEKGIFALTELKSLEQNIADELHRLSTAVWRFKAVSEEMAESEIDIDTRISDIERDKGLIYTDEQRQAIRELASNNVMVVTGGAGTGKSTTVGGMLSVFREATFAQCALSGRAAARLTEVTGTPGSTIHRLLGFDGVNFVYDKDNQLPYDIVILDEISMVGAEIFYDLLQAIPSGSKLIMLGDEGQLESIGLCNIFKDMLESKVIPVAKLTKIHRQAAKSAIVTESVKVRQGINLIEPGSCVREVRGELKDLELDIYDDKILTAEIIMDHYRKLIEAGVSPHDIQIVVPMKTRGLACTRAINAMVQDYINAKNKLIYVAVKGGENDVGYHLRLGDRVLCTKNFYRLKRPLGYEGAENDAEREFCPVYNGDRGVVVSVESERIIVNFDMWGEVEIPRKNFFDIELGYALSCHKLQGSEAPYVIIGFDFDSRILLTKEWVYTAITRAKKYCVIVAETKALTYAIGNSNIPYKRTFLRDMLREAFKK